MLKNAACSILVEKRDFFIDILVDKESDDNLVWSPTRLSEEEGKILNK